MRLVLNPALLDLLYRRLGIPLEFRVTGTVDIQQAADGEFIWRTADQKIVRLLAHNVLKVGLQSVKILGEGVFSLDVCTELLMDMTVQVSDGHNSSIRDLLKVGIITDPKKLKPKEFIKYYVLKKDFIGHRKGTIIQGFSGKAMINRKGKLYNLTNNTNIVKEITIDEYNELSKTSRTYKIN